MQKIKLQIVKRILVFLLLSIVCFSYQLRELYSWNFSADILFKEIQIPNLNASIACSPFEESFLNVVLTSRERLTKNKFFSNIDQTENSSKINFLRKNNMDIKLYGIILWKGNFYAFLKCKSKFFFVKRGDMVCDDIKVIDIQDTYITVEINGKVEILRIFSKGGTVKLSILTRVVSKS